MLYATLLAVTLAAALPRHAVFGAALADADGGVRITAVVPESAAAQADVRTGDVIERLGVARTPNTAAFLARIHALAAGARVEVALVRNGRRIIVPVVMGGPADERDPEVTTTYEAIDVDGTLRRTLLTVPTDTGGRHPAVLVIGGIGCLSVDVAANREDPYLRLTHDLARAGIVAMRLEKSGVGDSAGPPCRSVDFASEERSYAVALAALRADPRVDPARVYLFGHSIGSVIAPRLAAGGGVAGIVAVNGVGRDWLEYELRNVRRQEELAGTSAAAVDAAVHTKYVCMYRLLVANEAERAIERTLPACKDVNAVYPVDAPYLRQVAAVAIVDAWVRSAVPTLFIHGRSDFVTEEVDDVRLADAINAAHAGLAARISIDGMDHGLFRAASPAASLAAGRSATPRTYHAELSAAVTAWLQARTAGIPNGTTATIRDLS